MTGCMLLDTVYKEAASGVAWVGAALRLVLAEGHKVLYKQLLACDWLKNLNNRKSKHHQAALKDHIMRYLRRFDRDAGFNIESCHRLDA